MSIIPASEEVVRPCDRPRETCLRCSEYVCRLLQHPAIVTRGRSANIGNFSHTRLHRLYRSNGHHRGSELPRMISSTPLEPTRRRVIMRASSWQVLLPQGLEPRSLKNLKHAVARLQGSFITYVPHSLKTFVSSLTSSQYKE
jgi:hypothetical protein